MATNKNKANAYLSDETLKLLEDFKSSHDCSSLSNAVEVMILSFPGGDASVKTKLVNPSQQFDLAELHEKVLALESQMSKALTKEESKALISQTQEESKALVSHSYLTSKALPELKQEIMSQINEKLNTISDRLFSTITSEVKHQFQEFSLYFSDNLLHQSESRINSLVEEKIKIIQENLTNNQFSEQNLIEEIKQALIADADFTQQVQSLALATLKKTKVNGFAKINKSLQNEQLNFLDLTSVSEKTPVTLKAEYKSESERLEAIQTLKPLTQTQLAARFNLANSAPISLKLKAFGEGKISQSELESYIREHDPDNLMWVEDSVRGKKIFYKPII